MIGRRWRAFSLCGIPIYLDASWLLVLALLTLTLRERFAAADSALPAAGLWVMARTAALAFFACLVLHELGHALAGRASGIPFRGITLFLFGGVAELDGEPPSAGSEFVRAVAGPPVSVALAVTFWAGAVFGASAAWPSEVRLVLGYLATINVIVVAFNLVPAFPLDGGRIPRSILWGASGRLRRATRWAAGLGQAFAPLLAILGVIRHLKQRRRSQEVPPGRESSVTAGHTPPRFRIRAQPPVHRLGDRLRRRPPVPVPHSTGPTLEPPLELLRSTGGRSGLIPGDPVLAPSEALPSDVVGA